MSRKKYHSRNIFVWNCRNLRCEGVSALTVTTASFGMIHVNRVFYSEYRPDETDSRAPLASILIRWNAKVPPRVCFAGFS
jgi:hypothetical protein